MKIRIKRINDPAYGDVPLPRYMTPRAAGMDIFAANRETIVLAPMERILVPTGFAVEVPDGFEAQIRPRSGLALARGLTLLNSPGTIDPDYRGEVKLIVANLGTEPVTIVCGDRIAQMVIAPFARVDWEETDDLDKTGREDGGFGHTGV
jgi:dUTP pyrophosphatase